MHWTSEVEASIKKEVENFGIPEYMEKLNQQLNTLVELVCKPLTKQEQTTLNALIVIDVHAKDVVERLIKERVNDVGAFEWIA